MINSEIGDLTGYRLDGRKYNELRGTVIQLGQEKGASGSCYLKQGLTEVLCIVNGPIEVHNNSMLRRKQQIDQVTKMSCLRSATLLLRLVLCRGVSTQNSTKFAQNIRKSFEDLIFTDQYPRSTVQLIVTLIQNDGSSKSAILNCITLALINAGIAMRDFLISATVGFRNGPLLGFDHHYSDVTTEETYDLENELIVSFIYNKHMVDYIELKEAKLTGESLKKLLELAVSGCNTTYRRMKDALLENAFRQVLIK